MEKIKAALEKVKTNKLKPSISSEKKQKESVNENVNADIGEIDYTITKVLQLNFEHLEKNRIISHTYNANTSVIDSLRTKVLQKMDENNWRSIAIVSPTPNSGKTLVSINLAISIARQPQKSAALIDFDLRKPKVANYLGLEVESSLNEYLEGNAKLEEVLINPSIQRLVVAPTMRPITNAAEKLSSSRVTNMITELEGRYDSRVVIYDLPPMLNADDAMILISRADCVLMVVANGVSTATEIEDAIQLIPNEKLLGVVYNMAEEETNSYYY